MVDTVLAIARICNKFGGVQALTNIDLEIKTGEILGLVGDNGAGKSTLLKILTGAYKPTSGQIFFNGREVLV